LLSHPSGRRFTASLFAEPPHFFVPFFFFTLFVTCSAVGRNRTSSSRMLSERLVGSPRLRLGKCLPPSLPPFSSFWQPPPVLSVVRRFISSAIFAEYRAPGPSPYSRPLTLFSVRVLVGCAPPWPLGVDMKSSPRRVFLGRASPPRVNTLQFRYSTFPLTGLPFGLFSMCSLESRLSITPVLFHGTIALPSALDSRVLNVPSPSGLTHV